MRKRFILGLAAVLCLALSVGTSQAAAGNATHTVQQYSTPDNVCGFDGTSYWVIHLTGVPTGNGSFVQAGSVVQTFIADNGRGVTISYVKGSFITGPTVVYPDGSSSFTAVEDGLNVKTQAVGGGLLEQSTGRITLTYYFDANDNFLGMVIDSTSGPQNNTTGAPDCSVVGPYLAGS
jgi:hypothetical protein